MSIICIGMSLVCKIYLLWHTRIYFDMNYFIMTYFDNQKVITEKKGKKEKEKEGKVMKIMRTIVKYCLILTILL